MAPIICFCYLLKCSISSNIVWVRSETEIWIRTIMMLTAMANMLPYIINGSLYTYSFLSDLFTMPGPKLALNHDIFATLLNPTLHNDIASFVSSHYQFAPSTHKPYFSLQSWFLVMIVGLNKAGMPVKHESFAIWVLDKLTMNHHEFVIEWIPSSHSYPSRFSIFSQC